MARAELRFDGWSGLGGKGEQSCLEERGPIDRHVDCHHEDSDDRVIPPRVLLRKARAQHVMLEKSLRIGLDSAASPRCFFPWRQGAAEVERESRKGPGDGCNVQIGNPRPAEDQETAEDNERHVHHVTRDHEPCKQPVNHSLPRCLVPRSTLVFIAHLTDDWSLPSEPGAVSLIFIAVGFAAGILAGLFGVGGGLIIVPALILLAHFAPITAIGTSLTALLLPVGALGVWEYYRKGHVNIPAALFIAVGIFFGALLGAMLAHQLSPVQLKRAFAVFLVVVAGRLWFS